MDFRSISNVDLISVGKHKAMTGPFEFTEAHARSMIAAAQDPCIKDATLKIGHLDKRFAFQQDGEPAYGWVRNLRFDKGRLKGDYASMPAMLAELAEGTDEHPAPFRNRSVEITWDVTTPDGTKYPAVLTAVALLGVQPPAVKGLADIHRLYEPAEKVAASLDSAEIPTIVVFTSDLAAASGYKVEEISESGRNLVVEQTPKEDAQVDLKEIRTALGLEESADEDAIKAKLEELKAAEAKVAELQPKVEEAETQVKTLEEKVAASAPPEGFTVVDANLLSELQTKASEGAEAMKKWNDKHRDEQVEAAKRSGKISPHSVKAVTDQWDKGIITADVLASMPVIFPTTELGHAENPDNVSSTQTDDAYPQEWLTSEERARLLPQEAVNGNG